MSALERLDRDLGEIVREVLDRRDRSLLERLERSDQPATEDVDRTVDTLYAEFSEHVSGPDWEPSQHGKEVDDAIGNFLLHFPIEPHP